MSTPLRVALLGNPNIGKTTLLNRLCGLRAKTANLPGSTVAHRSGTCQLGDQTVEIIDLPGYYGLDLDRPESRVCQRYLAGELPGAQRPDAVIVVLDAANIGRNLLVAAEALSLGLPAIVVLNRIDLQEAVIDTHHLEEVLGCPVVATCARTGAGLDRLRELLPGGGRVANDLPPADSRDGWATELATTLLKRDESDRSDTRSDRIDRVVTHPVLGFLIFAAVMTGLFYAIFSLATVPMDLIDLAFQTVGAGVQSVLPAGPIRSLLVDGVIAGLAGTLVFLPQICLLFFLITLLEDTGYIARAAFMMDGIMRRFGLPGQSFVPLLTAHACAIPAIMSARLVPDGRERLATILVAPFMSCAARLPVYVLLIGVLFTDKPLLAGLAFTGCYLLGALAAIVSAFIARRTILRGGGKPMMVELPPYKVPSLMNAIRTTIERAWLFLRKAGTIIVAICIVLWWTGQYPVAAPPAAATAMVEQAESLRGVDEEQADQLAEEAALLTARHRKERTVIGRLGHFVEPVFRPLGYDWQVSVGVISSLLAREVFVSTMMVVVSGEEDDETEKVRSRLENATRSDGTPLFNLPTAASLLVFYVLAMQCLPTLAVTYRETGHWRWPALQFGWMSAVAWIAAFVTYHVVA